MSRKLTEIYQEHQKNCILNDIEDADTIKSIQNNLHRRQSVVGNLVLETHERAEAIKHLEIAEMYLRKQKE